MRSVVISAPFGNYGRFLSYLTGTDSFTPTLGTFTWQERGFWTKPYGGRFARLALTLRYNPAYKVWRNRLGLKNPGFPWLADQVINHKLNLAGKIVSIYGFNDLEWCNLRQKMEAMGKACPGFVEINASCPNVSKPPFKQYHFDKFGIATTIVKIPPVNYRPIVEMAYAAGVRHFHAVNTLPTPAGGMSGKVLLPLALDAVAAIRKEYPDSVIIGGGGISSVEDAYAFRERGANMVALGSMLFSPRNWSKVKKIVDAMDGYDKLAGVL